MPGKWITYQQVKIYMDSRKLGNTQVLSSAKTGISERTGRHVEYKKRQPPQGKPRPWRTRQDPLAEVWTRELEPMLADSPALRAITLLEYLQNKYSGHYPESLLRTLQRRVKDWRIHKGAQAGCHVPTSASTRDARTFRFYSAKANDY